MAEIRCITFDLDDTLWDCHPVISRAEHAQYAWLKEHYPRITQGLKADAFIARRMQYMRQRPELHHNLSRLRKEWLAMLAQQHSYEDHVAISEQGFRIFWEERNRVEFREGILESLERLGKSFSLGAITNGNADVDHIGVGHLFDFSIKSEDAGVAKPHPDIFHLAARKAGVPVSAILHVGDDPERDIRGAREVGMKTLWVNYANNPWSAEHKPHGSITHQQQLEIAIQTLCNEN